MLSMDVGEKLLLNRTCRHSTDCPPISGQLLQATTVGQKEESRQEAKPEEQKPHLMRGISSSAANKRPPQAPKERKIR
jgi:hypothetical protein